MNEIEKLYENVGVEKQEPLFCEHFNYSSDLYERCMRFHKYCADGHFGMKEMCPCGLSKSEREDMFKYPPFTAEKQLELIKWLSKRRLLNITFSNDKNTYQFFNDKCAGRFCSDLAMAIATLVQCELDFCTEEEKQQIKDILE